jgi:hypothetical protein
MDADIGECFQNFHMHRDAQQYFGVRVHNAEDGSEEMMAYTWLCFGARFAPYLAYQNEMRLMEICIGDTTLVTNPFGFVRVKLNILGPGYDPTKPRLMKLTADG